VTRHLSTKGILITFFGRRLYYLVGISGGMATSCGVLKQILPCPEWHDKEALVAHACNPSYSGGRDQKDHGSKPA
jgi:hypothetical protein